jgi:uncharacterized protein (TIRG00374 family)
MKTKKIAKFLLKLLVSLVFVAWLVLKINWKDVLVYAQRISLLQIIIYVGVLIFAMVISAYKWSILAKEKKFEFTLANYFQFYLAGTFINNFFPSFIGGDTYRAYQIGRPEKRYSAAAATVVMDRITGLLGAMVLSVVFAAINWSVISQHHVLVVILALVLAILCAMALLGPVTRLPLWKHFARYVPKKILEVIKDFADYRGTAALWQSMVGAIIYSFVGLALVNYVLFWGFGIHVGFLNYMTVIFLISIVSSIPVSVNNIGIKEWAYVTFFGFFGVSASAVVTVSLVSRVLQMVVSFAALPNYLKNKK